MKKNALLSYSPELKSGTRLVENCFIYRHTLRSNNEKLTHFRTIVHDRGQVHKPEHTRARAQ